MNPWMETIAITLLAFAGIFLGKRLSNLRKPCLYWMLGYFFPLALIATLIITRYSNILSFVPPWGWFITGRIKFVFLSLAVTIGLTAPLSRLPYKFEKAAICLLMIVVVSWFCISPFLVPALIKNQLSSLPTIVDSEGTCFQTKDYTCAPAAAVTALGKLGLPAKEGELAVLAHTSPIIGTLPWSLYTALQNRYETQGLKCQYRQFDSVNQLKNAGITLAAIKNTFLSDHCVAVLEVSDQMITFADPVLGKTSLTHKQFEKIWRFSGITLKRQTVQNI